MNSKKVVDIKNQIQIFIKEQSKDDGVFFKETEDDFSLITGK
jgi:hypothetical protein